jgi:hypothetical protein
MTGASPGGRPNGQDSVAERTIEDDAGLASAARSSKWRSFWSVPRAIAGVAGTAVITGLVAFYVPKVLNPGPSPGPPVETNVLDNTNAGQKVIVTRPPTADRAQPGPGCEGFQSWRATVGGADAGETAFDLVVQGNTSSAVYVAGIRARILSSQPTSRGVLAECPTAGTVTPRKILLPLDSSQAGQYITHGHNSPFGFTVGKGSTEVFDIGAFTRRAYVRWLLELEIVVGGHAQVLTIADHGRPFATAAPPPGLPQYVWNFNGTWTRAGSG